MRVWKRGKAAVVDIAKEGGSGRRARGAVVVVSVALNRVIARI